MLDNNLDVCEIPRCFVHECDIHLFNFKIKTFHSSLNVVTVILKKGLLEK